MVKNLPAVERSTKIRFGKNVPEATDQAENTIVFNASNVTVAATNPSAVYLSPIRNRPDYTPPEVVLLMYDKVTKEITESGESANALVGGATLALTVNRANATSNTVQFRGGGHADNNVGFVTDSNVGISNLSPQHTVSVGSNLYIDDVGQHVLVVSGNVSVLRDMIVEGNLTVNGDTTVIYTENTSIGDAFVELGKNNISEGTTLDLGLLMHRPGALSNVVVGYREGTDEFAIAYTTSGPTDQTFVPRTDEDIDVHVYGRVLTEANVGIINTSPIHTLDVGSNLYVDDLASNILVVRGNVDFLGDLTVTENVYIEEDLLVVGNTYVNRDLRVTENVFVSNNLTVTKNVLVSNILTVTGNTHLEGDNVFVTHTMDFLDPKTAIVTDQVSNVQIRLGQLENVSNTASNPVENQVLRYVGGEWLNDYSQQNFMRVKNGYSLAENITLQKGNTVYISDTQNAGLVQVKKAQSHVSTSMPCVGLVYEDITAEGEGVVLTYGVLTGLNTTHLNAGKTVYVSNVYSGYHTSEKPDDDVAASPDLIQNLGVCTRSHQSSGAIFVTGIGRANDIPNAELITDYNQMQYVYVNNSGNDLKKIASPNLNIPLTTAVSSSSNTAANAVTLRGISITSGDGFHGDLVVAGDVTVDTTTFHVNAETNRVGLGTTTPGATLDVVGNIYATANITTAANVFVLGAAASSSKDTGALIVTQGGLGVEANVHSTNVFAASHISIGTSDTTKALDVRGTANVGALTATSASVTDVTHSTSKDTGALVVTQGGLGVEANIHSTNVFAASHIAIGTVDTTKALDVRGTANVGALTATSASVTDVTHSTSKDTGALVVTQGGLGVEANVHSTNVFAASHIAIGTSDTTKALDVRGTANVGALTATSASVTDVTHSTSKDTGALIVTRGGLGVEANVHSTNVFAASHISIGTSDTTKALDVRGTANVGALTATSASVTNSTDSTTTVSGAMTITGGLGVAKSIFAQDVSVGSLTHKKIPYATSNKILADSYISQETDGTIVISNDVQITGTLLVSGESFTVSSGELVIQDRIIDIANNNPEHDLDIGILMEHPGHNIGIIHHATDELTIGYTQAGYGDDHVLWDTSNHITVNVWGYVITQNTITIEHNDLYVKDGLIGVGTTSPVADIHVVGNAFVTSNITTSSHVLVNGTDAATSKTSGALQVVGGVGVQGDIYATYANLEDLEADSVNITDDTTSTTTTSGALKVTGGMSTQENLNVGGVTKVWDDTDASTTTSGAVQILGGLGVVKSIHAADVTFESVNVTDSTASTSTDTGALTVSGGLGVAQNVYASNVLITGGVASTSTATGALRVTGGAGVTGSIYTARVYTDDYLTHIDDTNTYIGFPTADTFTVTTAGTERLRVDSTGRVGVGTTGPTSNLHVVGNVFVTSNITTSSNIFIKGTAASTSKTSGALQVVGGVGVQGDLFGANANLEDVEADSVNVTDTTTSTSTTTGALKVAGGVGISGALYGATATFDGPLRVNGGTIINSDKVSKKTYSFSNTIASGSQPEINVYFSSNIFYSKITAQLNDLDDEVSTLVLECGGGSRKGTPKDVAVGTKNIFGGASTNPWSSVINVDKDHISFKPSATIDNTGTGGNYHVFIEYSSPDVTLGKVTKITKGGTDEVTFSY